MNPWIQANHAFLIACLERVAALLDRHAGGEAPAPGEGWPPWSLGHPPALARLCKRAGLGAFERDLLLMCVGMECDGRFAARLAAAHGNPEMNYPTFSLALAALPDASWSALLPEAPLRRLGLVRLQEGPSATYARLRADERVWQHLLGLGGLDAWLARRASPAPDAAGLGERHAALADQIAAAWEIAAPGGAPVALLCGDRAADQRAVAAGVAERLGCGLLVLPAARLPADDDGLEELALRWRREVLLSGRGLLLDGWGVDRADRAVAGRIARLLEGAPGLVMAAAPERLDAGARPVATWTVERPPVAERRRRWEEALAGVVEAPGPLAAQLAAQFDLATDAVEAAVQRAAPALGAGGDAPLTALWRACRDQARPRMSGLAQRVPTGAGWDDLVLPEEPIETLRSVEATVRNRARVLGDWGFSRPGRGDGVVALFAGPSGTGKTLAAEVLAGALALDLWRIDLSSVVSKYIGETEENLRQVFDAAEAGGAVLLFDEADALFGKRSQVRDSHDRYANIEVSYLLQRLESYGGLAVLTSNLKGSLDPAFVRRLRFVVEFPFPDKALRARIWARAFPPGAPTTGLDPALLAQLNVSGATIRNIALHAAFLASEGGPGATIGPPEVLAAARLEYRKLQQPLSDFELQGWGI